MRRAFLMALVPTLAVVLAGCGDSTGVTVDDLVGTWNATEVVFTNQANTAETVDLIAQGGSFELVITADGGFTTSIVEPGEAMEIRTGTVTVVGDVVTIAESGQGSPTDFLASRNGNRLTLTTSDDEFDFDGDGTDEAASLRLELTRE